MDDPVTESVLDRVLGAVDIGGLSTVLTGLWLASLTRSYRRVGKQLGEEVKPDAGGRTGRRLSRLAAEQIKGIEETTRERVRAYVERAVSEGMSIGQLAKLLREDPSGAFGAARAATIARTESALALAHSSVAGWRDSGRVEKVIIRDGDGCGWSGHDDGDLADGSIRTLDDYEAHPLAHPNCRRSAAPALDL